jgi:RND family efflux transporter MFP subunit
MRNLVPWIVFLLSVSAARAEPIEGFTEPYRKVDVVPVEPGLLATLTVNEGDQVESDQVLGNLDSEVQEIALEIARANCAAVGKIESATAERDLRKKRAQKVSELLAKGHANEDEHNRSQAELAIAEANLRTALEQRKTDELECKKIATLIERRKIRSPIDGVVTRVYHEENEFVSSSATILTVMQLNPLRAILSVPTTSVNRLRVDQNVQLAFPESNAIGTGKVEYISPVCDAESGTVRVKVLIENTDAKYRSGERCTLELDSK